MSALIVSTLWTTFAVIGVVVNLFAVEDARIDREYAQTHIHQGTRSLVANSNIRRERVRLGIQIFFAVAGMISIANPPTQAFEGIRALLGIAMIAGSLLTVLNSVMDRVDRKNLLKLIDEQEEHRSRNEEMRRRAQEFLEKRDANFQTATEGALTRLEKAGDRAADAAEKVADELSSSQGRADAVEGEAGEAADAASRSEKKEE